MYFPFRIIFATDPNLNYAGPACLDMQTHMWGADIDRLEVFTRSGSTDTALFAVTGNQGNSWIRRRVTITYDSSKKVTNCMDVRIVKICQIVDNRIVPNKLSQKRNAKVVNHDNSVYRASFFAECMYYIFKRS